jgi:hypothetical protein
MYFALSSLTTNGLKLGNISKNGGTNNLYPDCDSCPDNQVEYKL